MRVLLSNSGLYSRLQRLLGAGAVRRAFVDEHLRPVPGERVLDLGCGPADIAELLPDVDYVGVDSNAAYVAAARARLRNRAAIHLADVLDFEPDSPGGFDAVIAVGLLHHLEDRAALRVFEMAARALGEQGRMLTADPAFEPGQPRVARLLMSLDRGSNVRSASGYRALATPSFESVETEVRHDLARVPYTHAILDARRPRIAGGGAAR